MKKKKFTEKQKQPNRRGKNDTFFPLTNRSRIDDNVDDNDGDGVDEEVIRQEAS